MLTTHATPVAASTGWLVWMLVVLQLGLGALHRVDVPRTHINATAVAEWQAGLKTSKVDYLLGHTSSHGPWSEEVLTAALERLPPPSTRYVAGIIYAQIGPWPPWSEYLALAAHANRANVAFYFLGPQLPLDIGGRCSNCVWLPLDLPLMRRRVETILNFTSGTIRMDSRKMCDLKPLWAALFPEIAGRHAWIGYADSDILFGNLSSEVAELQPEDEILTLLLLSAPYFQWRFLLCAASRSWSMPMFGAATGASCSWIASIDSLMSGDRTRITAAWPRYT